MGHDKEYEVIAKKGSGKKVKNMCEVAQRLVNEGRIEGQIEILVGLVNDQILTFSEAVKRANISKEEFRNKSEEIKSRNISQYTFKQVEKKKIKNMCDVTERLIDMGKSKGKIELLFDLINNHVLSFSEAAKRANISEEELWDELWENIEEYA